VAIISAIPKRFDLLVYRGMYNDLKNLMSINQHGFMKIRSTITNLLEYAGAFVQLRFPDIFDINFDIFVGYELKLVFVNFD
jgi:hypothetical protein